MGLIGDGPIGDALYRRWAYRQRRTIRKAALGQSRLGGPKPGSSGISAGDDKGIRSLLSCNPLASSRGYPGIFINFWCINILGFQVRVLIDQLDQNPGGNHGSWFTAGIKIFGS